MSDPKNAHITPELMHGSASTFRWKTALFGHAHFAEGEEYRKFQYRFACAVLLFSIIVTGMFLLAVHWHLSIYDPRYLQASQAYCLLALGGFWALRGHPQRLKPIAIMMSAVSWGMYVACLFIDPFDELRIIWFPLNLPGVYLILGTGAGIAVTIASIIAVIACNPYLDAPYSPSAITTCVFGMAYISAFFHAFSARSISFHHAMVKANRDLSEMASKDPLTGLYNGRAFYAMCDQALRQAQRSGQGFAMHFVDLDHFKRINDQYGHEAGDIVLRTVAARLQATFRQSDIVGRIGGEEFAALLPDTDLAGAQQLAERLRQDIEELMPDIGELHLKVTASIGVAAGAPSTLSIAEVQRQADQAMYTAKQQGRNRVTCITPAIQP